MPYLLVLGATPFAVRFAATTTGILTLAAAGRLGRELFGKWGAFWSVAALSVFYWHVHLSHLALRANLYVLIGTLAAAAIAHAYRTNLCHAWIAAGIALGLLGYSYFASMAWIGYLGLIVLGIVVFDQRRRKGAMLALSICTLVIMPMGVFLIHHPEQFLSRPATVALASYQGLTHNVQRWMAAWFQQGDLNHELNLPGRPILGPITGFLGALGLLGLVLLGRKWSYGPTLLGWGIAACLPSLLSEPAPHFLRASGMTVSIAITVGAGAYLLGLFLQYLLKSKLGMILPSLLFVSVGIATYRDFHLTWIHHPETSVVIERPLNQAVDYLRDHTSPTDYIYFSPFSPGHPLILFHGADLAPRPVAAFDSHQCLVLPAHSADYVSLTRYEPGFQQRLAQWASVTPLLVDPKDSYSVFAAEPYSDVGHHVANFGDALTVKLMQPPSTTLAPGDVLSVVLGVQALRTLDFVPSLFVHLYGVPTPYEGGVLWSQADSQLCASYPAHLWRTEETIIQSFALAIPPETPPGVYTVAIGIYAFPAGERLPVSAPGDPDLKYVNLHQLTIVREQ